MCFQEETFLLFVLFLFPCNFRTITLSFKKKLSPCHRGKCQLNPGVFSHFQALWQHMYMQHGNYWLQKEESILRCRLRSEVGISLLLLGSIAISIALFLFFMHFIFSTSCKVSRT